MLDKALLESAPLSKRFRDNMRVYESGDLEEYVNALLFKDGMRFSSKDGSVAWSREWQRGEYMDVIAGTESLRHSDVMLISPSPMEFPPKSQTGIRSYGAFLRGILPINQFADVGSWYHTFMIKYWQLATDGRKVQKTGREICSPVFEQEMKLVHPKFVIAMGTAVAAELGKFKSIKLERLTAMLHACTYTFSDGTEHSFRMLVVPSIYEMAGANASKFLEYFQKQMDYFNRVTTLTDSGRDLVNDVNANKCWHIIIDNPEDLKKEVDRIIGLAQEDPRRRIIAVDMEWKGHYPGQTGASLLTIQFSSAPYEAAVVVFDSFKLREKGGLSKADRKKMVTELNRLLTHHRDWKPRVGGHCLRADLPWLLDLGITGYQEHTGDMPVHDVLWSYMASKHLEDARVSGGWDTMHMAHAYDEKARSYGLKELAAEKLGMPAWDVELKACNAAWEKEHKQEIFGFGHVPDEILHPYAAMDADATRRLAELYMLGFEGTPALLDDDGYYWDEDEEKTPNPSWAPFWYAQRAAPGFLDMEMTGFVLDGNRYRNMCEKYSQAYAILLQAFRTLVDWPDFNPKSTAHKQAVLFGGVFGSKPDANGNRRPIMPDPTRAFNLMPVYESRDSTVWSDMLEALNYDQYRDARDQRVDWAKVQEDEARNQEILLYKREEIPAPAVDKKVLSLLAATASDYEGVPEYAAFGAQLLNDVCKLAHILDGVLSPREIVWDSKGYHELYKKGHYRFVHEDGRIHSHLMPTTTSGRTRSSKPNMQNIGKGSEEINQAIMGFNGKGRYMDESRTFKIPPDRNGNERGEVTVYLLGEEYYPGPMRTIYHGPPEYLIIEADYTGAELSAAAFASGDETMIDHVRRNSLPKDDPDYMDMHSEMACRAFGLNPPERTKKGLKAIGKEHYRSAAKSVVFGILYGRGAKSIAFQCKLEGAIVSVDEVKKMINTFFATYPKLKQFLEACKARVTNPGYVETLFGRKRRFRCTPNTPDDLKAQMQREFSNAPIQGSVADAVNVAIYNLLVAKHKNPLLDFHFAMQIHDSLVLMVHHKDFKVMRDEIIPNAMVRDNPIYAHGQEYHFSIEQDFYQYWGDKLSDEEAEALAEKMNKEYEPW